MADRNYSTKGGKKLRRCARKAGYYKAQEIRTARNKLRLANKRRAKLAYWRKRGVKRNGQLVKQPLPHIVILEELKS